MPETRCLQLHALGEVTHLLDIVRRGRDGFSEQRERTHGSLELVRDIRDEVATHGINAAVLGEVVDQDQDRAWSDQCGASAYLEQLSAERRAAHPKLLLAWLSPAGHLDSELDQVGDGHLRAVYQAEGHCPGGCPKHGTVSSDDHRGGGQDGKDSGDLLGNARKTLEVLVDLREGRVDLPMGSHVRRIWAPNWPLVPKRPPFPQSWTRVHLRHLLFIYEAESVHADATRSHFRPLPWCSYTCC